MVFGASTACFHGQYDTEVSLELLAKSGIKTCEIFLESYSEYTPEFGLKLAEIKSKYNLNINSIHAYVLHFESQLWRGTDRQMRDAEQLFRSILSIGKMLDARIYVMHGVANVKQNPFMPDISHTAQRYAELTKIADEYDLVLSIENVKWCMYSRPGLITQLNEKGMHPKCTLDIKQAKLSGHSYEEYLADMQSSIVNVHLSDYDQWGKLCLPGKGELDFTQVLSQIISTGFDGNMICEVYRHNFDGISDILHAIDYLYGCYSKV